MASPYTGKKMKWPSDRKQTGANVGDIVSDFAPYVSNLANMFRKMPKPMAPKLIDPVTGQRISLAEAKKQVENQSRVADLSTKDLDAQSGAAIRTGNMAARFRALSDIASREALANAQITNQTNALNANIDAQNTSIVNAYHDDLVNAQLAANQNASSNLSNAADKYIAQRAAKDQTKLEKDKAIISSKAYNPGVYNRLLTSLDKSGIDVSNLGTITQPNPFDKFKNAPVVSLTKVPSTKNSKPMSTSQQSVAATDNQEFLSSYMRKHRYKFATGGMMKVLGSEDPRKPILKEPVSTPRQFRGDATIGGVTATSDNFAMNFDTNRMARGIDVINSLVKSGTLPHKTESPSAIRALLDPKMYQYLYQFNQRGDMRGMNPEQRLQAFYNIPSSDPDIQGMKDNMKRYGYGPIAFDRGSSLGIKRNGGMMKPFC